MNDPNIMVGSDRLQIYDDQAIFVPIINAYQFASISEHADWGSLQDFTGSLIDNGDNPPDRGQLSIKYRDGYEPVALPDDLTMEDFRVVTPIFTALVPDAPYGTSLKDFLEEGSISPGSYHAIVEGYFVMLKLEPGEYLINCFASSGREVQGYYFSQLIYEIEVRARRPEEAVIRGGMRPKIFPARNEGILNEILRRKKESGELDQKRVQDIQESNNNIRSLIGV
ncbi:MAG TPA: hypothetical protein VJ729_15300 [Nitrososphaeraceae archaeon]|nr:hypothetical protein [Nitrososphaeraceae archaeon]